MLATLVQHVRISLGNPNPLDSTTNTIIVARTPSKLTSLLLSKGVSQSTITSQLNITEGDIRDVQAVKSVLSHDGKTAGIILSGIGKPSLLPPSQCPFQAPSRKIFGKNPLANLPGPTGAYTAKKVTICADAASTILGALTDINLAQKPLVLGISSTGISAGPRDVPLLFYPLYKVLLARAHEDKHNMETLLTAATAEGSSSNSIRGAVIVRASLLTNGAARGEPTLRVGSEQKPQVGYTVSREDVGQWIFENIVQNESRDRWLGEKVSLTY